MTEGEFERRIAQLEVCSNIPSFLQIIWEAKKDFPVFGHIEKEFLKKRQTAPLEDVKQQYVHAVYNWFEKWFGSTK